MCNCKDNEVCIKCCPECFTEDPQDKNLCEGCE